MKSEKLQMTGGIELPNQEKIRMLREKETYKYLGILEADTIKQVEMKEKNYKRVSQESEKTTRNQTTWQKSHQRDKYLGCPPRKILGMILKEDEGITSTNAKLMTMNKDLLPRDDIDRLYVSRKEGGRGLTSIQDSIDASVQWLEDDIKKH